MPKAPKPLEDQAGTAPRMITLSSFYSFYDEDGNHRQFQPGVVINDPETIALLIERQVEHQVAEQ